MATTTAGLPVHELSELRGAPDPNGLASRWRDEGPVFAAGPLQWGCTRHADVEALLRDRRLSSRFPRPYIAYVVGDGPSADFRERILLNRDAPEHVRLRRLLGTAFTPALVHSLREHVTELVDGLLGTLLDGGSFDLVADFAYPLPSMVVCELLGIGAHDRAEVQTWGSRLGSSDRALADEATRWFQRFMAAELRSHRPDPDGDLLARLRCATEGPDALSEEEIVDNATLLFLAGFGTTTHLLASGIVALLGQRDQWARLQADPTLAPLAVEELLRFEPPVPAVARLTLEPIEVAGHPIGALECVYLMVASANRDPAVFEHPDRIDIGRAPNAQIAFGGGPHRCLGAHLARLEGEVALRRLAESADLELVGEPERAVDANLGRWGSVPITGRLRG